MKPAVFIDVLLTENFSINYMLLYMIKRLCKIKSRNINIFSGALIGALYVIVAFYPTLHILYSLLMKIAVSVIMIIVSFYPYSLKKIIKYLLIFYIEAFILGGTILAIFFMCDTDIKIYNGIAVFNSITVKYLILGSLVAIIIIKISFDFLDEYNFYKNINVELDVVLNNKLCHINGFVDTGNSLKDPLTNESIIIVSSQAIKCILPEKLNVEIEENKSSPEILITMANTEYKTRLRLIPYNAVGTKSGILLGLRIDKITVYIKNKINIINNPVIALYNKPFKNSGEYQALVYPGIIKD